MRWARLRSEQRDHQRALGVGQRRHRDIGDPLAMLGAGKIDIALACRCIPFARLCHQLEQGRAERQKVGEILLQENAGAGVEELFGGGVHIDDLAAAARSPGLATVGPWRWKTPTQEPEANAPSLIAYNLSGKLSVYNIGKINLRKCRLGARACNFRQAGKEAALMSRTAILIVAAGKGERAGRAGPKQYEPLAGRPMLRRTADAFAGLPVRVVIGPGQEALYRAAMGPDAPPPILGGVRRQDSVRLGLEALAADPPDYVLIHDAARPLVSRATIGRVIAALEKGATGAVPMVPVADTLRRREGGTWTAVAREGLERAQTPQGFRFAAIMKAHRDHALAEATDDVAIAGLAGLAVEAVAGEEDNLKVTTEKDFALAERILGGKRAAPWAMTLTVSPRAIMSGCVA